MAETVFASGYIPPKRTAVPETVNQLMTLCPGLS